MDQCDGQCASVVVKRLIVSTEAAISTSTNLLGLSSRPVRVLCSLAFNILYVLYSLFSLSHQPATRPVRRSSEFRFSQDEDEKGMDVCMYCIIDWLPVHSTP